MDPCSPDHCLGIRWEALYKKIEDYKSARTSTIELAAKFSRFKFVIPNFSMNYFGCLIMKPFMSLH